LVVAQILMVLTLALMLSGLAPIYLTAIVGASIAGLAAGFPLAGDAETTLVKLINSGLNPVIADMAGVLLFIGIMEKTGFLDVIIKKIIQVGRKLGGGPGVAAAGGIAAGVLGALTGFTQPAITAVITGPAAVKLGVNPSKVAGIQSHAGHLGNFGGFTHPTMVAVVATAGIGFGKINVIGVIASLSIFAISYVRLKREEKAIGFKLSEDKLKEITDQFEAVSNGTSFGKAIFPFILLFVGFTLGFPVFLVGTVASILVVLLAGMPIAQGEKAMLDGVGKIATPLVATISFLFMSAVINKIGLVGILADWFSPVLSVAPIQIMLLVSALTGLFTQSNAASAAIVVPFLQIVLKTGADPFATAVAAAGGCAIMQYFLTGGPVAALATTIPVIPGSELKAANKFQRPSIFGGLIVLFIITMFL
jgi:hypothetical protein